MKNLFKNKNFVLLYFGQLVSNFGYVFYNFAISWFILEFTGSAQASGFYMAFGAIVFFVLTPFAGVLADRWDRVKIVYITDFIRGTTVAIAGLIIMTNATWAFTILGQSFSINFSDHTFKLVVLYVTSFIFSVNGALFSPAISTLTPYIVETNQLQKANALMSAQSALINIIGTISAAALYQILGVAWIFIINGGAYIASAISEIFITVKTKVVNHEPLTVKSAFTDLGKGFKFLVGYRPLLMFTLTGLIVNFFAAPIYSIGVPYLYNQLLQSKPIFYSFIGVVASIGSIGMSIVFTMIKQKEKVNGYLRTGLLLWVPILLIQTLLAFLVLNNVITFNWFFGLSLFFAMIDGIIGVFVNTPINVAFQKYVPKDMLGRVNSMLSTMVSGLVPISVALAGIFLEYRSLPELYLVCSIGFALGAVLSWTSKSIRQF